MLVPVYDFWRSWDKFPYYVSSGTISGTKERKKFVRKFLSDLTEKNVEFWIEEDQFNFRDADCALTDLELDTINRNKKEIKEEILKGGHITQVLPLSFGQKALWILYQLKPQSSSNHMAFAIRIYSSVDFCALKHAFQTVVDRHDCLRSEIFIDDNREPQQRIYSYKKSNIQHIEATGWDEEKLRFAVKRCYMEPFDLLKGPLVRASLFARCETDHVFLITVHHIVFDGVSLFSMLREFKKTYAAKAGGSKVNLPSLKHSYRDFVKWQSELVSSPRGEELFAYWRDRLDDATTILDFPTDHPRPDKPSDRGATFFFAIDGELKDRLIQVARNIGSDLPTILTAAFQVLLHRYTQQEDILLSYTTSGRSSIKFARICGLFVNPVILRSVVSEDPVFSEFLLQAAETLAQAVKHQDYPFQLLVEKLNFARDSKQAPLAQVAVNYIKTPKTDNIGELIALGDNRLRIDFGGMIAQSYRLSQQEGQFDLYLEFAEGEEELLCQFKYRTDLYEEDTISRMSGHFLNLLRAVVDNPETRLSKLPLMSGAEKKEILQLNEMDTVIPGDACLHGLFEQHARQTPDRTALVFGTSRCTYRELNMRANKLAHFLISSDVGLDDPVGICLERSSDLIVAIVAVLKAGGAYVPLDPDYPKERLKYMVKDAGIFLIVTQMKLAALVPEGQAHAVCLDLDWEEIAKHSDSNLDGGATSKNTAYVLYTSGSTGKPKGVPIEHKSAVAWLYAFEKVAPSDKKLSGTTVCPVGFDASVQEYFSILCFGGALHILLPGIFADAASYVDYLVENEITSVFIPPALLPGVVEKYEDRFLDTRDEIMLARMSVGVEPIKQDLFQRMRNLSSGMSLINGYGPTETTICATFFDFKSSTDPKRRIPIGRPAANYKIFLLDAALNLVPKGVVGEVFIGGDGVFRGYLNLPELTAEKLVQKSFGDSDDCRLFRTGDLARWLPDGNLEFLGRKDHQVKIRGFRVELGEIEAVLKDHPHLAEAVALDLEKADGSKFLSAYVVPNTNQDLKIRSLRKYLNEKLPSYMVPTYFRILESMPLTSSGKVDRNKLISLDAEEPDSSENDAPPRSRTEKILANVWTSIIGIDNIGVHDRFFDIGGNSLALAQVKNRVSESLGIDIPFHLYFERQTICELAESIDKAIVHNTSCAEGNHPSPACRKTIRNYSETDWKVKPPFQSLLQKATRMISYLLVRVKVKGEENVPDSGPLIVIGNHINWLDAPLLFCRTTDSFQSASARPGFIAAHRWKRLFHWYFRQIGIPIYVRRGTGELHAIEHALSILRSKGVVGVAPEGTFNHGKLIKAQVGAVHLATQSGAPVLPVVVYGQEKALKSWKRMRRVPVRIHIGRPILLPKGEATHTELERYTDLAMSAMAKLMPPAYRGVYAEQEYSAEDI